MDTKNLTLNELIYVRSDLQETINLQEKMNKTGYNTPKLGQYWDQLFEICAEIKRRKGR